MFSIGFLRLPDFGVVKVNLSYLPATATGSLFEQPQRCPISSFPKHHCIAWSCGCQLIWLLRLSMREPFHYGFQAFSIRIRSILGAWSLSTDRRFLVRLIDYNFCFLKYPNLEETLPFGKTTICFIGGQSVASISRQPRCLRYVGYQ